ncbi:MAG: Unknown protein [uncultured Thiotrichaceae bacterium]|uniref:Uncharacterized protein n=1 Tax=uncultured Thiotrichaceae bacterium TaxID=298394 RepID=A0A6S6UER7_9GAMM|nr:MAG: Unknown protein [uncultured Thiotrichaceae bacterium]
MTSNTILRLISLLLLAVVAIPLNISAEENPSPEFKAMGVSLEWYRHEFDLNVTQVKTTFPGVSAAQMDAIKAQLDSFNDVEVVNLRLDRQVHPYLNIFGSIGQVANTTQVGFSRLAPGVSDMEVDNDGTAYSVGATFSRQYGKVIGSFDYIYSYINLDKNNDEIVVHSAVPSLGVLTKVGTVSLGFAYQAIEVDYSGVVTAPFVGDVPVTVATENDDDIQLLAGLHTRLAKDWYMTANVGLNGQEQLRLQFNKRF